MDAATSGTLDTILYLFVSSARHLNSVSYPMYNFEFLDSSEEKLKYSQILTDQPEQGVRLS